MQKVIFIFIIFIPFTAFAQRGVNSENLVKAAHERLKSFVIYNGKYVKLKYPMGDVHKNTGVCTDVIIRSYRQLGLDFQQLIHEDMKAHFSSYPKNWGLKKPDTNIDHRRVPNIRRFLKRKGYSLPITKNPNDYRAGDIVTWRLANNLPHIGIVVDQKSSKSIPLIIHNIGWGPKLEDFLFGAKITGHYRYFPVK